MSEVVLVPGSQTPDSMCMKQILHLKKHSGKIALVIPDFRVWFDSLPDNFEFWSEPVNMITNGKEVLQFKIKMILNKPTDDDIGFYLHSFSDRDLKVELSFIAVKGEQYKTSTGTCSFAKLGAWGYKNFLSKKELMKETTQFLPGGVLTVVCLFSFTTSESEISTSHNGGGTTLSTCLANNYKTMWKKEAFADFKLICENQVFPCHKFVLASRSDVFEAMFSHKDTTEALTGEAIIKSCTPQVLASFLEFLYTDQLENTKCLDSCELMLLADKYNVPSLKKVCEKNLGLNLNCNNAIEKLHLATLVTAPELLEITAKFVTNHFHKLYDSEDWKKMIENNPEALSALAKFGTPQQASQPVVSNYTSAFLEQFKMFKM